MTINRGNYSSTRINLSYDVEIIDNEKSYFYSFSCTYGKGFSRRISPLELTNPVPILWEDLDTEIQKAHFWVINPEGTEEEMNLYVFGKAKGSKLNSLNKWADAHMVFSREITLQLVEKLGYFTKVEFLRTISRMPGTGYKDYLFVIDSKWQVTVIANCYEAGDFYDTYKIEDYDEIRAKQKAFGRRVAKLAKEADVPWHIGVFVGHIEQDYIAVAILRAIKYYKETYMTEKIRRELKCGIKRRTSAIIQLLGDELWESLHCDGQNQTSTLAYYLLSE